MRTPVEVREGRAADAPALARLYLAARAAAMPGLHEPHNEQDVAGWLAATLMARHRVRLAEIGGVPLGYIGFGQDARHGPMVFHLYLDPAWRRRGIGTRLLAEAAEALGPRLSLFCFARNTAARRFYEAQGFRLAGCGDGTGNEEREPDVFYVRDAAPAPTTTTREQAHE